MLRWWSPAAAVGRVLRLLRRGLRRWPRKLELGSLIPCIDASLPLTTVVFCDLDKIRRGCIVWKLRYQERVLVLNADRLLDQLYEVSKLLGTKVFQAEGLLEVLVVVKCQVSFTKARPIRVIQILLEPMQKQVHLIASREQGPVFIDKVCEQWFSIAYISDILNRHDINVLCVDFQRLSLFFLVLATLSLLLFCFLLCFLFLLGYQGLPFHWVFVIALPFPPFLQRLLPLGPPLLEPCTWLQVLYTLDELFLEYPFLQQAGARVLALPCKGYFIEAFLFSWQRKARKRLCKSPFTKVRGIKLAVPHYLLFFRQLHRNILVHLGILLLFIFRCLLFRFRHLLALLLLLCRLLCLPRLLRLLPLLLQQSLPFLLLSPSLLLGVRLALLVRKQQGLNPFFVLLAGLTHDDCGGPRELRGPKPSECLLSLISNEVGPKLRHNVAPPLRWGHSSKYTPHAHVVQHRDSEFDVHLVVGAGDPL
mmetsp:Transcript_92694/g.258182  ORF Transcript_92694/g.258182 Transcript_92694/m.258182 type:complete len:477 (+) Transcript_92694:431-1861(+)